MTGHGGGEKRQADQQRKEQSDRGGRGGTADRMWQAKTIARHWGAQQQQADQAAEDDGGKLPPRRRQRQHHDGCHDGEHGAGAIGRQRPHHRQHGLSHHRHRGDHQPVQPAAVQRIAKRGDAIAK